MKLSTKGRYGLRALLDIAVHQEEGAVNIRAISVRQGISESYLEQLIMKLRKADLVESIRGVGGGYRLTKSTSEISVGDVLRALEGSLDAVDCPGTGSETSCSAKDSCVTKYVWQRVNDSINKAVDGIMLSELVEDCRKSSENNQAYEQCQ